MVLKRQFDDEASCEHPCKQPKQLDCRNQFPSFANVSCSDFSQKHHFLDYESDGGLNKCQYGDRLVSDNAATDKVFDVSAPGSISSFSWVSRNTNEDNLKSEIAGCFPFFPGLFEPGHSIRSHTEDEDINSAGFDYFPRKLVSIGPDHQADIPPWGGHIMKIELDSSDKAVPIPPDPLWSNQNIGEGDSEKMMGICVIPMPGSEASVFGRDDVGKGRTDCCCPDQGSMRCARLHIMEAREKLMGTLGKATFVELGFNDTGEEVATRWNENDEQIFNEVVFSNPASLGKNFWDHLSLVFPSRTKEEIVSYYFNVFVLRRRGEQNRLDPLNIDSDDDEWQASEDGDDEIRATEEDEDSVVESREYDDFPLQRKHFNEDVDSGDESCDNNPGNDDGAPRDDDGGKLDHVSEAHKKPRSEYSFGPSYPLIEEDNDLQDDSCTSYECQFSRPESSYPVAKQECRVESDHTLRDKHCQNNFNGLNSMNNLGYNMEHCDAKVWDVNFFTSCKTDDLLPTSNMIDEVFGDEDWDNWGKDK